MTQAQDYQTIYSDVYESSSSEDFYEKQTADQMTSELSEYIIEV